MVHCRSSGLVTMLCLSEVVFDIDDYDYTMSGMLNISEIVMPEYFRNGYVGISPK